MGTFYTVTKTKLFRINISNKLSQESSKSLDSSGGSANFEIINFWGMNAYLHMIAFSMDKYVVKCKPAEHYPRFSMNVCPEVIDGHNRTYIKM